MKRIFLYGLASAEDQYRPVAYSYIEPEFISVKNINAHAAWLKLHNPTVESVYMIDDRRGLKYDYLNTLKHNTIEGNIVFKDMLERDGSRLNLD